MSKPLEVRGPAVPALPLVLDSPHSGHDFPDDFGAAVSETELREGEDCFVDELFAAGPEMGAPLLAALWPRTYLDPNRHAGDVDLELLQGPWPGEYRPSGKARVGKALIWRTLEDGSVHEVLKNYPAEGELIKRSARLGWGANVELLPYHWLLSFWAPR